MSGFQYKNKETNTFRFKSFGERVNDIDIRKAALYYIGHENEELPEDDETYFHQTIKKWIVLNLTAEYNEFSKKCQNIVTLPQLIHKKDFIVDFLLEKLSTATTLSLQPLLEIIVVLGRDLREEFYPYLQRILDRLICLLNTQDADQLEWTLICLAFLFKTLKPFLKKNITIVFNSILPLLDESRFSEQVTNFAVECFAFVARDITDIDHLLETILTSVENEGTQGVNGCGCLFFEIIRGVNGQFHSIAEKFLNFLFGSLLNCKYNQNLLIDIISITASKILQSIHSHNMTLFWITLCRTIEKSLHSDPFIESATNNLLDLLCTGVEYKNGKHLNELDVVVACILIILDNCPVKTPLQKTSMLICSILLSTNAKVSQLDTSRLCKKIINIPHRTIFEKFCWNICDHPQFEILILPSLLKYLEQYFDKQSLELMVKIILKKSPNLILSNEWEKYPLILKKKESKDKLLKIMQNFDLNNYDEYLLAVIILPHIKGIDLKQFKELIQNDCKKICQNLQEDNYLSNQIFILYVIISNLFNITEELEKDFYQTVSTEILKFCSQEKYILALKILYLILKKSNENGVNMINSKLFNEIHSHLSNNLCSQFKEMRLITAHTLNLFNNIKKLEINGAYEIFYKIENIQPTINTYREQLLLMQKFLPDGEYFKNIKNSLVKFDCLKFLLGLLYYNFKLLWDPTLKMIEEFSAVLDVQTFWDIYKYKLEQTANIINKINPQDCVIKQNFDSEILNIFYENNIQNDGKIDYYNYRNLLWSKLSNFGQITETKNRDIITLFLEFINTEYRTVQENKVLMWNLMQTNDTTQLGDETFSDNDEENEDTEKKIKKFKRQKLQTNENKSIKNVITTLCTKLLIFKNQSNPKQLYREPELYALYLELLSGTNSQLQKLSLDCILAYKNKSLIPYKDNLYGLIDEKKFKDELTNFKINKDNGKIITEHRKDFIPICLRILYGKMITKNSTNIDGQVRKGIVLRFLGGCEKSEIFLFLKMAFNLYENYIDGNFDEIHKKVETNLNLENVWSPKKMQSTINLLELIRKEFGGLMDSDFLIYMLKLITFIGSVCENVIKQSDRINQPKIITVFKNVKNVTLISLVNFFQHFEDFQWSEQQIKVLTEIFVWPNLEKIPQDSIHSPTPLLKLLITWSENYRHFSFLIQMDETKKLIPFKYIIQLLLNEKAKPIVHKTIMEMIERLLMVDNEITNDETNTVNLNSIGVSVIRPYVSDILKRLKHSFHQKKGRKSLEKRDLNILSVLTQLVEQPEVCESLLQLIVPIFVSKSQKGSNEEILEKVITTISNLIKKLDKPEEYIRKIAPLFEHITEVKARKMLCSLVYDISKKDSKRCPQLVETSKIIKELNAWDKRWIEQPDYDKRLMALMKIKTKLTEQTVDMDLGLLVIYNCLYFLKYDKDMGMRDNATEHIKFLVPKLIERYKNSRKDVDYLISNVLLDFVRRTITDSNDNVRNEGILILGELACECSKYHQILQDLNLLTDKEDEEVDFFKNITHLQSYRHGKALLRFCSVSNSMKVLPSYKTLTQFILPLAARYLLNEKYTGKNSLIDAAIETIGVICQLLPWHQYLAILKYYLNKMRYSHDYQKQCVRIVVTILNAFHFDLTKSNDDDLIEFKILSKIKNEVTESAIKEENQDNVEEENLDMELNEIFDNENAEEKIELITNKTTVLTASAAKKVIQTIATILIPTLNHSITEKSSYDAKHKINRKRFSMEREEELILRVPIALALVKLLQKLPKQILDNSIPGVIIKVCTFLKSPLKSVRMLTRDILKQIMVTLGTSYLAMLLEQLTTLLTRGFQVHVLSVTVHGVLDVLKESFQPCDIESCLTNILDVSLNDIFGEIAVEKEINKFITHTPEAKPSSKSYLTLHIAARNISESCLLDILLPFKDLLAKSQSKNIVTKIQESFQKIVTGLVENKNISRESLLVFIYGTISESIIDLLPGLEKPILSETDREKMRRARPSCLIIQEMPKNRRIRRNVKTNAKANAHILIEFGLEMLHIVLKRKKLEDISYQPFLNPLLPLLKDSLKSAHIRVTTFALKCFTALWNGNYQVENIKEHLDTIVDQIFQILHKNSTFGNTKKDDNYHLVNNCFKTVVALLRNCNEYSVNNDHITQLLFYIEQDYHESDKQPMAFSLLKAIIYRKIDIKEIHDIMQKICEISIVSQSDYARDEARTILIFYLMEYSLKKKIDSIIKFFTTQLNYEVHNGRLSAIKFLQLIVRKFPQEILIRKSEFLFLTLGTRMVNEEIPECRIGVAECIENLIARLDKDSKQKLFDIVLILLENGDKSSVREMAAIMCSRFISQEKQGFMPRIEIILPILVARLTMSNPKATGRFVKAINKNYFTENDNELKNKDNDHNELDETIKALKEDQKQKAIDHELIQIQNSILKILEFCPEILKNNSILNSTFDELAYESQKLLGYEHEWVRLNAIKILSIIISNLDSELIGNIILKKCKLDENYIDFIYWNPESDLKSLILDLCAQMVPGESNEKMTEEIIKIFIFIANMLKTIPLQTNESLVKQTKLETENFNNLQKISLPWLFRRMRYVIHGEISKAPHSCVLRTSVFNWIEGLVTLLNIEKIEEMAQTLLSPLVREMSDEDQNIDQKLRQQAIRIGNKIKKIIGADIYDKLRANIQTKLMIKRAERRKQIAQEKINDPVRAVKRKQNIASRKKIAKKLKIDIIKGKVEGKRKRKRKLDDEIY